MKGFYRGGRRPGQRPETADTHRVNDRILAREIRLISDSGEQLGIRQTRDALRMAEEAGMDLVEVAPEARPPVCRLMDYGKLKYREQKKAAEARKKRAEVNIKELRIRYRTDSGDIETKLRQAREFLMEGDKVKFSMRFRGREVMYMELGLERFKELAQRLSDLAVVDDQSPATGKQIYMVLAPLKGKPAAAGGATEPHKSEQ